jgi:cytochrome P450
MTGQFNLKELATASPYGVLAQLREEDPVHWSAELKGWVLTRYGDVRTALADEENYSSSRMQPFFDSLSKEKAAQVEMLSRYIPLWLVFRQAPDHTRLRDALRAPLGQSAMSNLRDKVGNLVDSLIDGFIARGATNLIDDFALKLPGFVVLDMLGAPRSDLQALTHDTNELQLFLGQAQGSRDRYARAEAGVRHMRDYFVQLVAEKRAKPGEDLTTMLVESVRNGVMSEDELISYCILLFFGGQETTANLIGNGLISLIKHPEELQKLRNHPELSRSAVDECLRYNGPIGAVVRVAGRDIELGGKTIRAGDRVFAMVSAANRDPAQFADPDRFDIERKNNRYLTFGMGSHFCLGAPLAILEAEIALSRLVTRLDGLTLATEELEWRDGLNMRGVTSLPLRFTPKQAAG